MECLTALHLKGINCTASWQGRKFCGRYPKEPQARLTIRVIYKHNDNIK
jgi:hypothetical protein